MPIIESPIESGPTKGAVMRYPKAFDPSGAEMRSPGADDLDFVNPEIDQPDVAILDAENWYM